MTYIANVNHQAGVKGMPMGVCWARPAQFLYLHKFVTSFAWNFILGTIQLLVKNFLSPCILLGGGMSPELSPQSLSLSPSNWWRVAFVFDDNNDLLQFHADFSW